MRYLDSTARAATSSLGHWLSQEVPGEQAHLRIKSGYFTLNGLGALKSSIDQLVLNDSPISIVLGANEKATIQSDVDDLYTLMGCPRPKAKLCVVTCAGGLFHPKVVHLLRTDGSQLAYVGSANATSAGFNGTNIEAGLLLDSRNGDSAAILDEIAVSIDAWFQGAQAGVTNIAGPATTQQLVTAGVLGLVKQNLGNSAPGSSGSGSTASKVPLVPLVSFPSLAEPAQSSVTSGGTGQAAATLVQSPSQAVWTCNGFAPVT